MPKNYLSQKGRGNVGPFSAQTHDLFAFGMTLQRFWFQNVDGIRLDNTWNRQAEQGETSPLEAEIATNLLQAG